MACGAAFDLEPSAIHGCDICETSAKSRDDLVFTATDAARLPYPDGHFQIVSVIMALHHFYDVGAVLKEIGRILAPGGVLIIREHDCQSTSFGLFLDIVHYVYAVVTNPEVSLDEFDDVSHTLRSTFRTKEKWARMITGGRNKTFASIGRLLPISGNLGSGGGARRPDLYNSYYQFFQKRRPAE